MTTPSSVYRFIFISSNRSWGGSEELWSATAAVLAEAGHEVTIFKGVIPEEQPRIKRLRELKCRIFDLARVPLIPRAVSEFSSRLSYALMTLQQNISVKFRLAFHRSDLVVISQGGNLDGAELADICRRRKRPYVLIVQKAAEMYWPFDKRLPQLRAVYEAAEASYFVSAHNHHLTVEQLGIDLPRAHVVRNPFLVPWARRTDWPSEEGGLRLACVGRLYPTEKGQDVLLRVLGRDKWRERALSVTFFGTGLHRGGLQRMADRMGLTSVTFRGFVDDVAAIWRDHHALALPSRAEGLPLVLVEAMLSGRVSIVTNVAGNGEVVDDGETGFLAAAATEDAMDEALERAWQRRHEWRQIGELAASRIRTLVPSDPASTFAEMLLEVVPVASRSRTSQRVTASAPR